MPDKLPSQMTPEELSAYAASLQQQNPIQAPAVPLPNIAPNPALAAYGSAIQQPGGVADQMAANVNAPAPGMLASILGALFGGTSAKELAGPQAAVKTPLDMQEDLRRQQAEEEARRKQFGQLAPPSGQ